MRYDILSSSHRPYFCHGQDATFQASRSHLHVFPQNIELCHKRDIMYFSITECKHLKHMH